MHAGNGLVKVHACDSRYQNNLASDPPRMEGLLSNGRAYA